ncbi:MAG: isoleucine--tRNA ligase, partial [Firmicutes bacterium]|nr:isoleucine--tRNA ligase [Bacillota bacterium]
RRDDLSDQWEKLLEVRDTVLQALETARQEKVIGQSLGATVDLYEVRDESVRGRQSTFLADLFIVSQVRVHDPSESAPEGAIRSSAAAVTVRAAEGEKCARCWHVVEDLGTVTAYPDLCGRCAAILEA